MKKTEKKSYMGGGPVAYRDGGRVRRKDSELAPETSPRPRPRPASEASVRPPSRSQRDAEQFQRGMNRLLEEEERTTRGMKAGGKVKGYAKGGKVDQMQCSPRKQEAMKGR